MLQTQKHDMKLIIAGTRTFNNTRLLDIEVQKFLNELKCVRPEIVSGGAKGDDLLGERWARKHGLEVTRFNPDWATHGLAAGPIRNRDMAVYAKTCIVFWDGASRGTKSMISQAQKAGLHLKVVYYK